MPPNVYGSNEIALGERVDIEFGDHIGISNVQDITDEDKLIISMPTIKNIPMPIKAEERMKVIYYRQSGMYVFTAEKIRDIKEDGVTFVEIQVKSPVSKSQRRDFVRYEKELPVKFRYINDIKDEFDIEQGLKRANDYKNLGAPRPVGEGVTVYEGMTLDLSGGGMRFSSNDEVESETIMEVTVFLTPERPMAFDCFIVRCDKNENKAIKGEYVICARFENIHEGLRQRLIKFIFDEQIKEHRRKA